MRPLRVKIALLSAAYDRSKPAGFDEDIVFVERFLAGEVAAFEVLYARYYDKVYSISRGVLLDQDEAADAVQEIFTLVYRHLNRFDRRAKFSTWLFRIAVNRSIQQARRLKYQHRQVELTESLTPADAVVEPPADPHIDEALARLAPADRALLTLFYWDELSLQEIADSLETNVNAAKTRLYRARERFRQLYEEAQGK